MGLQLLLTVKNSRQRCPHTVTAIHCPKYHNFKNKIFIMDYTTTFDKYSPNPLFPGVRFLIAFQELNSGCEYDHAESSDTTSSASSLLVFPKLLPSSWKISSSEESTLSRIFSWIDLYSFSLLSFSDSHITIRSSLSEICRIASSIFSTSTLLLFISDLSIPTLRNVSIAMLFSSLMDSSDSFCTTKKSETLALP